VADLTNEQYEAIGRLSISVNDIEYVVGEMLRYFLSAKVDTVGELYLKRDRLLSQKRDMLKKVITEVSNSFPHIAASADAAKSTLLQIDRLATDRNNLIHGQLIIDCATKTAQLQSKGAIVPSGAAHINSLAVKAKQLADDLVIHCGEILFGAGLI